METETLRPSGAGSETSIALQFPNATYHWDKVDEVISDSHSTYIYDSAGVYHRDLFTIPPHSTGVGTINKITVYFMWKSTTSITAYAKASIKSGATIADGDEYTTSTGYYIQSSQVWATDPNTSQEWTWDAIDALQIGVSLKGLGTSYEFCTQVYVSIDYTPLSIIPIMMGQYQRRRLG